MNLQNQTAETPTMPDFSDTIDQLVCSIEARRNYRQNALQRRRALALKVYNGPDNWDDPEELLPDVIELRDGKKATRVDSISEFMLDEDELGEAA